MATKFFSHATPAECTAAPGDGKYGLCNLTGNKVEVDEDAHFIPPRGCAIIDKINPIIEGLVERGVLSVADPKAPKTTKARSKAAQAAEEPKEEQKEEPASSTKPSSVMSQPCHDPLEFSSDTVRSR